MSATPDDSGGGTGGPPTTVETNIEVPDVPFTGPFFQKVAKRKREGRDAKIILTADHGQTGVSKTSLGVYLAKALDTSESGFGASEKSTLDVQEFNEFYTRLKPESAAILDEAEQLDARRAMSHENVDTSEKWQMNRVDEIYSLFILPSPDVIDSRLESLADFWINVECRGRAKIYEKRVQRMPPRNVYYKTLQFFEWPNMDADRDYQILSRKKRERLDDETTDDNWMRRDEVEDLLDRRERELRQELRDKWIVSLKEHDVEGTEIADLDCVEITPQRVNQIARESKFSSGGEESQDGTGSSP